MKTLIYGRPAYHILFPICDPTRTPPNPISRPSFGGVPPYQVYVRNGRDPTSSASAASGAYRVNPHLETRLVTMQFGVWEIEERLAGDWRAGVGEDSDVPSFLRHVG